MARNPLAPEWLDVPIDANALAPQVWSANTERLASGSLTVAGVGVRELAERYGTPLYVMDEADVRARAIRVREAFEREFARVGSRAKVYYAGKAFLSAEIARWMTEESLYLDVCSQGELAVALAAGIAADRLAFHGNNKSLAEIDRAVGVGIGVIVLDSFIEIDRVQAAASRHGRVQAVRVRVNSGVHAHTHEYLATAREDQKFGITIADATAAVSIIRSHPQLEFLGLHSHIGSQIYGTDAFAEAARRLMTLQARLLEQGPVPELNLGGGFGIAYTSIDEALDVDLIAAQLADIVSSEAARLGIPVPVVALEPGRVIVGNSTFTLYEVGTIKDVEVTADDGSAVRRYVSVDGGMSDNIRTALYAADYSARIAGRRSDAEPALVRIVGKHCESGDIVVSADYLPGDVAPGDLVAVPATGAYCWAMSSNYNHVGRPPVVAVRDGESRIIVHGETEADLLARDAGIRSADGEGRPAPVRAAFVSAAPVTTTPVRAPSAEAVPAEAVAAKGSA